MEMLSELWMKTTYFKAAIFINICPLEFLKDMSKGHAKCPLEGPVEPPNSSYLLDSWAKIFIIKLIRVLHFVCWALCANFLN
jgi:hypothetical protein